MRKYCVNVSANCMLCSPNLCRIIRCWTEIFPCFFPSVAKKIPVHSTHINTFALLRRAGISTVLRTAISSIPIALPIPTNFLLASSLAHGVF